MRVRGWTPNSLIIKTSLYKLRIIKASPHTHTPLRQLADFLRRGRGDGQHTRKNFWTASFKLKKLIKWQILPPQT